MKDINMHICPTCGGKLNVDIERQMYECPFCGVTFDYDYFREESVLGIAAQSLMNKEFTSAGRAYDFMLEKEPDNFEALRGKSLIALNIPKIADIRPVDLYSKINYESAYKEIDRAIGSSKPQDREYFNVMKDIVDAGHEYTDKKAQIETHKTDRGRTLDILCGLVEEKDTVCIYSSSRIRLKKAVILTIICYIFCCLMIFLGFKYINRNPYSKAEDLSKYETEQNDSNSNFDAISDYMDYQRALEREEQRKINYDIWEKNHKPSDGNLIWIEVSFTVIFALIVFILFMWGRYLNAEISKLQALVDEQTDNIKNCEKIMAESKDRIGQDYERLCELHPVNE